MTDGDQRKYGTVSVCTIETTNDDLTILISGCSTGAANMFDLSSQNKDETTVNIELEDFVSNVPL